MSDAPVAAAPPPGGLSKARVETLVDGVFAIAMTLLVLDLRPPDPYIPSMRVYLIDELPTFLAYVLSFASLGVFWVGHHTQFEAIRRTDRPMAWITILFLMSISLVPFSTATLARHWTEPGAVAIYGANFFAAGLSLLLSWRYATKGRRLVDPDLPDERVRLASHRILFGIGIIGAGMASSLIDTRISLAFFVAVPLYFVFPGAVDRFWAAAPGAEKNPPP